MFQLPFFQHIILYVYYFCCSILQLPFQGDQVEIACFIKEQVKQKLKKCLEEAQSYLQPQSGQKLALVIDGKCLMHASDPSLRVMLLNLSLNCHSVVCCRVSPLQKAQVNSCSVFNNLVFVIDI